jgi:signal peptidase I
MNRDDNKQATSTDADFASDDDERGELVVRAERIRTEGNRETVEALVVAFILALLFRAFIAEAFVIPTGSMAPTLMGAHKDVFCDRCGQNFRVGASLERYGNVMRSAVIGGVCPNCRHVNPMDLTSSDDQTFNGDRILVSKFAYTLNEPERFDVIVFKFPGNPKQNYIKRLVGLPGETLSISHGDVYARKHGSDAEADAIIRKPPEKLLAMRHHVYDTDYQSASLIAADYPSRWQPWQPGASAPTSDVWEIQRSEDGFQANVKSDAANPQWLRYFHRWPSDEQWEIADKGGSLAEVDPYSSRLITDFYAYNSFVHVDKSLVYDLAPGERRPGRGGLFALIGGIFGKVKSIATGPNVEFNAQYDPEQSIDQFGGMEIYGSSEQDLGRDGLHWVGDLICEADVEPGADCKQLIFELVEAGIQFQCRVDASTGKATLSILRDGQTLSFSGDGGDATASPTAETSLTAGTRHQVRFSNCDDELLLWVDDDLISFDGPTTFDARKFLTTQTDRPHFRPGEHPLDAAPVGVAFQGGSGTVHRLRIDRDKYYIATKVGSGEMQDYDMAMNRRLGGGGISERQIQAAFMQPDLWSDMVLWQTRDKVSFTMEEDQFFPMGDNSPASLDARCWIGSKRGVGLPRRISKDAYKWSDADYVPRDLLVGKALLVFWPHPWNRPVPMTPNFKRFKLIR